MAPVSMQDAVRGILDELRKVREEEKRVISLLKDQFEEFLKEDLQIGTILSIDTPGVAYGAKVMRGQRYRSTLRVEGQFHVNILPSHPELSNWDVTVISYDVEQKRTVGKPLNLKGRVFPLASIAIRPCDTGEDFIIAEIDSFERRKAKEITSIKSREEAQLASIERHKASVRERDA
jgi:hypothetical protein